MHSKLIFRRIAILLLLLALPLLPHVRAADLGVERQVYAFLTENMGLNTAAACGVLANIEAESGFSLTSYGDGGTSFGLCQWHNSRFDSLRSFCIRQGYDYTSLEGQLNYLSYELRTRYPSTYAVLKNVSNTSDGAYEAAYYWCVNFEAPANREEAGVRRGRNAQFKYWVRYGGTPVDGSFTTEVTSNGYSSYQFSAWTNASFYWEEDVPEETQAAPSAPSSGTASSAAPAQAAAPQAAESHATGSRTAEIQRTEPQESAAVSRFHYVAHHSPAATPSVPSGVSPLSCLFLCGGDPRKRSLLLPEPGESELPEEEEE